ncbi:MAG TPA: hypothetical protein VFH43_00485, partial [Candidatus Kapabacteria bacterium]|nr:hypothetical protein [Candidatus Kapabacteria bacterium]
MRPFVVCCALLISVTFFTSRSSIAQWRSDSLTNTPVAIAKHAQTHPKIAPDGAGGAYVVWQDIRTTYNWDIYAQHLDANGNRLWGEGGKAICTAAFDQHTPIIIEDGLGGAFIVWEDDRNLGGSDIYAQHIQSDGSISYEANGVAAGQAAREQQDAVIALLKPGRAVVAFEDYRAPSSAARPDVSLNVLTLSGPLYGSNAWEVVPSQGGQREPRLIADNRGGALLAWESDYGVPGGVHASLLDSSGALRWNGGGNIPGVQIFKGLSSANYSTNIGLGLSGEKFLMAWEVQSQTSNIGKDIYANRISRTGDREWVSSIEVTSEWTSDQTNPSIVPDDSGGFIVIFEDYPGDFAPKYWNRDIVAVRFNANGSERTPTYANGFFNIVKQSRAQIGYQVVEESDRVYFAWDDARASTDDTAIYAQAIDRSMKRVYPSLGAASSWGKPIAVRTDAQQEHVTMCKRDGGGVFIAWTDNRNGNQDIYAQVM